jgi:hypothetical protein
MRKENAMRRIITCVLGAVLLIGFQIGAEAQDVTTVSSHSGTGLEPVRLGTQDVNSASIPSQAQILAATARLQQIYSFQELDRGVYVGSRFCIACHPGRITWEETLHSRFLRRPLVQYSLMPQQGVIADYDSNGVDDFIQGLNFNNIASVFDAYKPNAPILSVEGGTYFVTIGALKMPVTFTLAGQGGDSAQRYVVKIPVADTPTGLSNSNYFAPLQFVPGTGWTTNSPQEWYDAGNNPRWGPGMNAAALDAHGGNYAKTCVGCHVTGIRGLPTTPQGEKSFEGYTAVLFQADDPTVFDWDGDGDFELMNIGCEDCHGPGSAHILGGGDPSKIVNPEDLPASAKVDICGRCHSEPVSVPNGTYPWPYNDATGEDYTPVLAAQGVPLSDFYEDATVLWPDGKHGKITRPYHDFLESPKPTFRFGPVTCPDCHNPHRQGEEHMIRTSLVEDGIRIPTDVDNNTLCLACHATHGPFADLTHEMIANIEEQEVLDQVENVVSAHSHHPYAPERRLGLSRCVKCHMPPMSGFGTLSTPSHTFEPVSPTKTLIYQAEGGMPNACAISCHGFKVDVFDLGIDPNPNNSVWDSAFDRMLARDLQVYYGPDGIWWQTDENGVPE